MIFFADENVSHRVVRLLEAFDQRHEIRALEHYFEKGTDDVVWLEEIAKWDPRPVLLCGDGRILRNKAEQAVLRGCDLMFVYLAPGWTNLPWRDFAWKIIKVWPSIVHDVEKARRAAILEVSVKEKVELKGLVADLLRR